MKKVFLKSMLLLCALIVGSLNGWAADAEVASGTFNGKNATYTTGWTTNGTGKSRTDCIVIGSEENITSPVLDLSGYSKITITFTGRRYGQLTSSKATVDASISGSSMGTIDITNGTVGDVTGDIHFTPTETMTAVNIVFTCTNATSGGSTHGAGIGSITIKGTPLSLDPSIDAENIIINYDATGGTIESTINNPVDGGILTAQKKISADWLTLGSVSGTNVPFTTSTNDGATNRTATVTLTYTYNTSETVTKDVTITQNHEERDYATLPFNWEGGGKTALKALDGVTTSSLDDDYADSNAPYLVKFNKTGKFIIIKTNCQPGQVTMGVKMIGGSTTSTMTIQESADGETYTDVQALSISGSSNDVVNLETTNPFKEDTRYVKFYYTKGSNVGVGPITIYPGANITIASACTDGEKYYATYCNSSAFIVPEGITVSAVKITSGHLDLSATYSTGDVVAANTGVLISSKTAGEKTVVLSSEAGTAKDGNLLYPGGVTAEEMATAHPSCKYYKLALKKDDGDGYVANTAGFYWGATDGFAFDSHANKAYLAVPNPQQGAPAHYLLNEEENNTTSINDIEASDKAVKLIENGRILILRDGITYDALGRKIR